MTTSRFRPIRFGSVLVLATLLLQVSVAVQAAESDRLVIAELWVELDPIIRGPGNEPLSREEALEFLMEEAQFVASGMIYGFSFSYEPSDPGRGIAERFALTPHATVVRGDPRLRFFQTWLEDDRFFARLTYTLDQSQLGWFEAWHSSAIPRASGVGSSSMFGGQVAMLDAIRDGVRAAVKEHVRQQEFNRPRTIEGAVLLADTPDVTILQGSYQADVDVFLQVDRIQRYEEY